MRNNKHLFGSLLLMVFSLMFAGLVCEGVLRMLGYKGAPGSLITNIRLVDDHVLNWRYIPNSVVQTGNIVNRYNSAGYRDVDHVIRRSERVKRIIVLGDSVTEGSGVQWQDIFAVRLQNALGSQYELFNLAMSGLNTPQEVHLLEREGIAYQPDLVVLNFVLNDCDFYSAIDPEQRWAKEKDSKIGMLNFPINPEFKRFLKSSAFVYFVKERMENLIGKALGREEVNYFVSLWDNPENRLKVLAGLDKLERLKRDSNFRVVVMIWPLIMDFDKYEFTAIHSWILSETEKRGFFAIDLLPYFSKLHFRDLQVTAEDNVHPNASGHHIAADAFIEWFRRESIL